MPPRVFVELRQLYALLWQVRVMHHSLPAFYAGTTGPDFIAFDSGVTAHQSSLANDKARRDRLASQGRELLDTLTRIRARQRLLEDVLAARANEPGQGPQAGGHARRRVLVPWRHLLARPPRTSRSPRRR